MKTIKQIPNITVTRNKAGEVSGYFVQVYHNKSRIRRKFPFSKYLTPAKALKAATAYRNHIFATVVTNRIPGHRSTVTRKDGEIAGVRYYEHGNIKRYVATGFINGRQKVKVFNVTKNRTAAQARLLAIGARKKFIIEGRRKQT